MLVLNGCAAILSTILLRMFVSGRDYVGLGLFNSFCYFILGALLALDARRLRVLRNALLGWWLATVAAWLYLVLRQLDGFSEVGSTLLLLVVFTILPLTFTLLVAPRGNLRHGHR